MHGYKTGDDVVGLRLHAVADPFFHYRSSGLALDRPTPYDEDILLLERPSISHIHTQDPMLLIDLLSFIFLINPPAFEFVIH